MLNMSNQISAKNYTFSSRLIPVLFYFLLSILLITITGCGGKYKEYRLDCEKYHDPFQKTFNQIENVTKTDLKNPILTWDCPIEGIFSCDISDAHISDDLKASLKKHSMNLYSFDDTNLYFDIYNQRAFGELRDKQQDLTYNNLNIHTDKFIKVERIMVKAPYYTFELLQEKLYQKIKHCSGDGAIDLCGYWSDYQEQGFTYTVTAVLTATIIKLRKNIVPNRNYILATANMDPEKTLGLDCIDTRLNKTKLRDAVKHEKPTIKNSIDMEFQYVKPGSFKARVDVIV